jgi:hypothetical protein
MEKMGQAAETSAGHASAGERHLKTYHLKQCPVLKKAPFQRWKLLTFLYRLQLTKLVHQDPWHHQTPKAPSLQLFMHNLLLPT